MAAAKAVPSFDDIIQAGKEPFQLNLGTVAELGKTVYVGRTKPLPMRSLAKDVEQAHPRLVGSESLAQDPA